MINPEPKTICIAGASGLAGAYIVKAALNRGFRVHGTLRDASHNEKAGVLRSFASASDRLRLFSADAADSGSFDEPLTGADAVFITCFPAVNHGIDGTPAAQLDPDRGWNEIIHPAEQGCLNIMKAALRQNVKTVLLCSSTASAEPAAPSAIKHELRDISVAEQQIGQKKYSQAQKTVMEAAAEKFASKNGIRLCTLLPSMMVGEPLLPSHLTGHVLGFLANLHQGKTGWHKTVPAGSMSLTSPEDLAAMFLAAWSNQEASGRYFAVSGSWSWHEIYQEISEYVPLEALPTPLGREPESPTQFDFTRRDSLGTTFKDMHEMLAAFYHKYEQVRLLPQL
ncbi:NAD-dependent epimerase/dehydratase family protein [Pseudovibrio sp. Tun.PSC04-5.I4]|uniref:NAD-dependent epimerase/dehydratase family protein n=1 Tax=Pseudovibrio sp. Tun.PSC04-5.I4 TaxID=1798213 RepID=UPI00089032D6|nr:NAD-dependent epimerase/dehydratase family protein [Pseudovibrio sp. Tun.PSC04-5.I4]SDQ13958.1 Nucleoside-diphosphate-sugar epimerase [Pseudovibrio sp. Tun.PSC04-5.I4]SDQ33458.1 Nucleoside-diphosphate-sugar epimerase [Pseudovibrio sp. Tun.PSC04-5.I4]